MSLADAVDVLNDLSRARPLTNHSQLVAGALALDTATWTSDDKNLGDAAAALRLLATGGELHLDEIGHRRAAHLASIVSALIATKAE
jgi:hypothetical protein